jgi:uncharacterized DUF497 family protein
MSGLKFEWDEKKNAANRRKHGISFAEAKTAFLDGNARVIPDPEQSDDEERFVLLGVSISRVGSMSLLPPTWRRDSNHLSSQS